MECIYKPIDKIDIKKYWADMKNAGEKYDTMKDENILMGVHNMIHKMFENNIKGKE